MVLFIGIGAIVVALLLNLGLTLGLATRVHKLQEEVNRGLMRDPALPRPGDVVGAFDARAIGDERVTSATLSKGVQLVGIFAPGCPDCARVRGQLLATPPPMPFVAFIDVAGSPEVELEGRAVADTMTPIAKVVITRQGEAPLLAFREAGVPTLIRLENGVVTASGHRLADVLPELPAQAPGLAA